MRDALRRFVRPTREERRAQRGRDTWIVIGGCYLLLTLAYFWPPDSATRAGLPMEWAWFMVRVLQFHLGLLVLAVGAFALARRNWRASLAAVPLVLFTLVPSTWSYVDPPDRRSSSSTPTRLMTANLLVSNDQRSEMAKEIIRVDPHVLVLQEYSIAWHDSLAPALGDELPYSSFDVREDSFGSAIYSHSHVGEDDTRSLILGSGDTPQTRTVIQIDDEDVAVYNIHLLPPINLDYVREGHRQFDDLVTEIKREELPVIVVGDLNLTETTPQHATLKKLGLRDAWDVRGRGRGATWPNNSFLRYLPGLRLDHIYVSEDIDVLDVTIGDGHGSDHRPVIAELAMLDR